MRHAAGDVQNYAFGATLSVAEFMITEDLERFILNHPESHIRVEVANTKELLMKLDAGELDFAIIEGEFPKMNMSIFFIVRKNMWQQEIKKLRKDSGEHR